MSNAITDQQQGASFGFMRANGSSMTNGGMNNTTSGDNHSSFNGNGNASGNRSTFLYTANNSHSGSTRSRANNVPVKYKICFNNQSSAFTVTLLIPVHLPEHANDASPFKMLSLAEGAPSFNENGEPVQTYVLRIPLSYLVNQSSQEGSDADMHKSSAWLDRNTLRTRIDEGGHAIGLDQQQIYHAVAAVEQTASKLPHWCPRSTQTVTVDIILTDPNVTLLASSTHNTNALPPPTRNHSTGHYDQGLGSSSPPQRYYHHSSSSNSIIGSNPQSKSQPSPVINRSNNYNVFNETSGELVATAPSFPPPPGMRSSSIPGSSLPTNNHKNVNVDGSHRNIYNNMNNNSFSAFSPPGKNRNDELNNSNGSRNNVFNSPLLSSSFGSWAGYPPNNNNNVDKADQKQSEHLSFSNLGPTSLPEPEANERNIFRMSSEPTRTTNFLEQALNVDSAASNPFTYQFENDIFRNSSELTSNQPQSESMNGRHSQMSNHNNNNNSSSNHDNNKTCPDPSIIIGPLLSMGFSKEECEAAANAIRNISLQSRSVVENESSLKNESEKDNQYFNQMNESYSAKVEEKSAGSQSDSNESPGYIEVANSLNNVSLLGNGDKLEKKVHQDSTADEVLPKSTNSNSVWGNAGKLKTIKNPSTEHVEKAIPKINDGGNDVDTSSSRSVSTSEGGSSKKQTQQQKMVKVLDIPSDLNAFIFHCNAQTRDECLERGLFGCPSGGQYGPHSKAKKGDLLFLADFSAWTVTGVFTANCDAGLNLEKSAWGGRFPWQIRVNEWNELRTVHIDKINEIIGLASGSKLNMLTKDQLTQLVSSKEFGPCVPWLFKMKTQEP